MGKLWYNGFEGGESWMEEAESVISIFNIMFSTGDVIAIIVAIIAFVGVIISTIYTNYTTRKISKDNERQLYELNQKNIDANLVANARIEWIQNVRRTTAELIAQYFSIINTLDKEILTDAVLKANEKTQLLILYFGPEDNKEEDIDLYNEKDNATKNKYIVDFLNELSDKTDIYYSNVMIDKLIKLKDVKNRRLENLSEHVIDWDYEEIITDEGETFLNQTPILEDEYDASLNILDEEIERIAELTNNIQQDLINLQNIIRIYLKIEWNIAKRGK